MNLRSSLALILLLQLIVGCGPTVSIQPVDPLVGKPAPDFQATMLEGEPFNLSEKLGQTIILDFWATWCGPCLSELPVLLRVAKEFQDRGVTLYTVNVREDPNVVREFMREYRFEMNVVHDFGAVSKAYNVDGIPHLVIIDRQGIVRQVHTGYHRDLERELREEARPVNQQVDQALPNGMR